MSGDSVAVVGFFAIFTGTVLVVFVNIGIAGGKVSRWDARSTLWFMMSITHFGEKQVDMWMSKMGYSESES